MAAESNDLEAMLKPFYQRASEAEYVCDLAFMFDELGDENGGPWKNIQISNERLARLEAALAGNKESGDKELLKSVDELQLKPENSKPEHVVEKQETMQVVMQLRAENEKLRYRIIHLVRALEDADSKLALK